ncbi:hypothetical protein TNCV_4062281 [Trichonephila clavipes]|nr:hypothetical protein TNCV_4062281 [Trichonephila clavipes]
MASSSSSIYIQSSANKLCAFKHAHSKTVQNRRDACCVRNMLSSAAAVTCLWVQVLVILKVYCVEGRLLVKSVEDLRPRISVVWKFRDCVASLGVVLVT